MFILFTDFGVAGPYLGQMKAVLLRAAPRLPIVDLFADAPACDPHLAAPLLAAYAEVAHPGDVVLAVVDPGVGTDRRPVVARIGGRWLVGPDNGLLALVVRRAGGAVDAWEIAWRPPRLSASFHGRDLFAPVAAMLALGQAPPGPPIDPATLDRPAWPDDLPAIVYCDTYGNAMTGLRAASLPSDAMLIAAGRAIRRGRTFADAAPGTPLWYENANGLAEIAVNCGRADRELGLRPGACVAVTAGLPEQIGKASV